MSLEEARMPFVFLRPLWLLGLLALPGLVWGWQRLQRTNAWESYIAPDKLRFLDTERYVDRRHARTAVVACLAFALVALAGPSWRSLPLPVKQSRDAMIIAFDLSPSMLATDLRPDRITRARLKLVDLLRRRVEGETALIAYAADAYRVTPLTDDAATIEALVPSLHPDVMPAPGSQVEAAAAMARELLAGATLEEGVLLVITDGIDPDAIPALEAELGESLRLCILAVGSDEAVPIPLPSGGFARDGSGQTVLTKPSRSALSRLASRHGSCFAELTTDDSDLRRIETRSGPQLGDALEETETDFDTRQDEGYWLVLLLLPAVALGFRKNVLWMVAVGLGLSSLAPTPGHALEWADLWQRPDQREFRRREEGVELYRNGDYAGAAERFGGKAVPDYYNRGNSLALAGELEEALESYDAALEQAPEDADARFNRDLVARLLENQQQPESDSSSNSESQDPNEDQQDSDPGEQDEDSEGEGSENESQSDSNPSEDSQPQQDPSDPDSQNEPNPSEAQDSPEDESQDPDETRGGEPEDAEPEGDEEENAQAARPAEPEQAPLSDLSEQWLRNIPDDPGGLMRRKFQVQSEMRRQQEARGRRQRRETRY